MSGLSEDVGGVRYRTVYVIPEECDELAVFPEDRLGRLARGVGLVRVPPGTEYRIQNTEYR